MKCLSAGLRRIGALRADDVILARDRVVIDPAHVVFDPHRAAVRDKLLDMLIERDVQSIGRHALRPPLATDR